MKNNYLILAATLASMLALSACNRLETVNAVREPGVISFCTNLDYALLRGTEINLRTLRQDGFWVAAISENGTLLFNERVSYGTPIPNRWSTATPHYWPKTGTVRFWAYEHKDDSHKYDGTPSVELEYNSTQRYIGVFYIPDASSTKSSVERMTDVVIAYGEGTKAANESTGVQLTFKHAMAQVEIMAKNDNPNREIAVLGVQLVGVSEYAVINLPERGGDYSWDNDESVGENFDDLGNANTAVHLNSIPRRIMPSPAGNNFMMFPQQLTACDYGVDKNGYLIEPDGTFNGAYIGVMMQVTENGVPLYPTADQMAADPHAYIIGTVPINTLWEAGKKYTYVLDFTNGIGLHPPKKMRHIPEPNPGVTLSLIHI